MTEVTKKKGIKIRHAQRGKTHTDYKHTLSPEDAAWLDQFDDEYAANAKLKLHPAHYKKELYDAYNAAQRDLFTATSDEVQLQLRFIYSQLAASKKPEKISRWYTPADYQKIEEEEEED